VSELLLVLVLCWGWSGTLLSPTPPYLPRLPHPSINTLPPTSAQALASYFDGTPPKVIITTSINPKGETFKFAEELLNIIPNSEVFPRKNVSLKDIIKGANERGYVPFSSSSSLSLPLPSLVA
jgi:hypothetical protein